MRAPPVEPVQLFLVLAPGGAALSRCLEPGRDGIEPPRGFAARSARAGGACTVLELCRLHLHTRPAHAVVERRPRGRSNAGWRAHQ
ncbi:MAG: hypothetical protein AVDCRST_MAG11-2338 [uncultured Gemmatimonadaceae bacterium]|uniref:Uncharacterized protein n=1 Tax=uncultured Gemmatimonadaceae bacterium TaxID=246130 RepID=A0A6J4LDV9_9BACT|nr:MAG: hypothetical protein AVDCRST_MAG11-2338 [uncultured Gemmatimonadaceae bacterium]